VGRALRSCCRPSLLSRGALARRLGCVSALSVCLAACAPSPRPPTGPGLLAQLPSPSQPLRGVWHPVEPGDTLSEIALRYGVEQEDLSELNDLADPDRLAAGQELFVPGAGRVIPRAAAPPAVAAASKQRPAAAPGLFRWPLRGGRLSSRFGRRWGRQHEGIDIAAPKGSPIYAAAAGVVIYSGTQRGYGNLILVKHGARWVTVYAHNHRNGVKQGQRVAQGDAIGEVGSTGRSTGPHLHFEIRDGGKPRNPLTFLPPR